MRPQYTGLKMSIKRLSSNSNENCENYINENILSLTNSNQTAGTMWPILSRHVNFNHRTREYGYTWNLAHLKTLLLTRLIQHSSTSPYESPTLVFCLLLVVSTPIALALLLCLNLFTTYTVSPYYPRFYSGKCFPIWRSKSPNMDIYSSHPLVTILKSYNLLCLISLAMSHEYLTSFRDTCPHCPRTFQWRIGLISHLRTHMP